MLSFVFSRSDNHLTIKSFRIYWIKIDHVLLKMIMIDSYETVHSLAPQSSTIYNNAIKNNHTIKNVYFNDAEKMVSCKKNTCIYDLKH